jgi:hypothetical protein
MMSYASRRDGLEEAGSRLCVRAVSTNQIKAEKEKRE